MTLSDRGVPYIPPYAVDARRLHLTMKWVVLLLIFERVSGEIAIDDITAQVLRVHLRGVPAEPGNCLYQKYPRTSSMFRSVYRVKLIMSIPKCDPNETC